MASPDNFQMHRVIRDDTLVARRRQMLRRTPRWIAPRSAMGRNNFRIATGSITCYLCDSK